MLHLGHLCHKIKRSSHHTASLGCGPRCSCSSAGQGRWKLLPPAAGHLQEWVCTGWEWSLWHQGYAQCGAWALCPGLANWQEKGAVVEMRVSDTQDPRSGSFLLCILGRGLFREGAGRVDSLWSGLSEAWGRTVGQRPLNLKILDTP
jgi:hypothetical protein